MEEVLKYLENSGTFYIATIDGDQPRVRPFGAVMEYNGKLYLSTNSKKPVFNQMIQNPKIEISAMGKDGSWIRLEAKAISDSDRNARVKMLEKYPSLTGMYSADDGIMEVLYLAEATATFYSFSAGPRTVTF